jgi:cytochrome c-type biogenesis protein CcmH/NrfF
VLYKPPFKATTVLLWIGPMLLALTGLMLGWRATGGSSLSRQTAVSLEPGDNALRGSPPEWD